MWKRESGHSIPERPTRGATIIVVADCSFNLPTSLIVLPAMSLMLKCVG